MFRARLPPNLPNCHACQGICTWSPLRAALTMRFAKNTQHDTTEVLWLPRKCNTSSATSQKYCACFAKRLSTRYQTRPHATKCHACHTKRSGMTLETSKRDPSCRTSHRHGHMAITRGRLRTMRTSANRCDVQRTHLHPQTPRVKREPVLRIREQAINYRLEIG